MTIQNIASQLQSLFPGQDFLSNYLGIANIDPYDIQQAFSSMYDINMADLDPAMYAKITKPNLEAGLMKSYTPRLEASSRSLLGNLLTKGRGTQARTAKGGFAGSGQYQDYLTGIRDEYGKSMAGVIAPLQSEMASSQQSVFDTVQNWFDMSQSIAADPTLV